MKETPQRIASILASIGSSRAYTLHSHTEFCDGRAQMEAFAREVVARGFTHYGFTPHSPVPIESPCNMTRHRIVPYNAEFERIRDTYGDRVTFYRSMEIDYFSPQWGPTNEFFYSLDLDYRLASVHFIPSQDGVYIDIDGRYESFMRKMHDYFHDDIRYVVEKFYEHSLQMVAEGAFDIIGHLDKIGHNASHYQPGIEAEPWYRALRTELIDNAIDAGLVIEINTKTWREHSRMFPAVETWPYLLSRGATLVVNSDAHVPALIDAGRPEAFAMLDEAKQKLTQPNPTRFNPS